ncbi:MAG: hypothetical protein KDE20_02505 [Caldilineaceae bacterium]|nr:hypothetical protein [Caldilineaceae bacterium]
MLARIRAWFQGRRSAAPVATPAPPAKPASRPAQSRPSPASHTRVVEQAAPALAVPAKSAAKAKPCPHGKRRREYCAICDPDGFRRNFGDWRSD